MVIAAAALACHDASTGPDDADNGVAADVTGDWQGEMQNDAVAAESLFVSLAQNDEGTVTGHGALTVLLKGEPPVSLPPGLDSLLAIPSADTLQFGVTGQLRGSDLALSFADSVPDGFASVGPSLSFHATATNSEISGALILRDPGGFTTQIPGIVLHRVPPT
ncbi:MAG TPA: hypothetical protein VFK13_08470 [Gemmatimonadaceae bacterium]|nr:hypothetical protein [Gemmatimonadaceae bacterium]